LLRSELIEAETLRDLSPRVEEYRQYICCPEDLLHCDWSGFLPPLQRADVAQK